MLIIKVKTESLPTRCEICHQSDLFDANNNFCDRCNTISIDTKTSDNSSVKYSKLHPFSKLKPINLSLTFILSLIYGFNLLSEYGIWYIKNPLLASLVLFIIFLNIFFVAACSHKLDKYILLFIVLAFCFIF